MTFGKKTSFSLLLGLVLLTNILELTHVNFLGASTFISFFTYILLPGFLISLILRIRKISFWENLLFIVGLSIAFLEFGGLLLNMLLPLLGINDPLAFQNLVIGFDLYVLLLLTLAWIRTKPFLLHIPARSALVSRTNSIKYNNPNQYKRSGKIETDYMAIADADTITSIRIPSPRRSTIEKVMYVLPVFFPVLATLGAIVLNNGGSSILTLVLLGAIALYSLLLVLLRNKIAVDLFPYALFFIGMAALFTTSLRSWYISGHDVEQEFYVFQLTNTHHLWSMAFFQDAYNACLSITILPTILTNLLAISDTYIFKVIFQILFATSPVLVFFIIRNYAAPVFAFLSAFFFISFPGYFNDMPMLNRQEIGFIFFGLVLYMMLKRNKPLQLIFGLNVPSSTEISLSMRKLLFVIFAAGVIVSHYSTNFTLLELVLFQYVIMFIISRPLMKRTFAFLSSKFHITPKHAFINNRFLSFPLICFLLLATFVWNNLYTNSSNHANSVMAEIIDSLFVQPKANDRSGDLSYSIFFNYHEDPNQELQGYIQKIKESNNANQFYDQSITSKYPTNPAEQELLSPTPLGTWLTSLHIPVFEIQAELRTFSADFLQVFVLIGLIYMSLSKKKKAFDLQYLLLSFGAIFLLALLTVLPVLSLEYGIGRMFAQMLFILSLPIVIGQNSVLFFIKEQKRVLIIGIIATIFFLNLTGFISHLTGDYYPQMTVDNAGLYYDAYYVHKSDIVAIDWLSVNQNNNDPVESDLPGVNKLLPLGHIFASTQIFPPIIPKNAYVFLLGSSYTIVAIDNNVLIYYTTSQSFLDTNKNHIYSNGNDNIYR